MANWALGIDLGGTKVGIGLVDASGKVGPKEKIKTSHAGPDAVVADIVSAAKRLIGDEKILAAGVGMAGQIADRSGLVHFAPNLGWKDFPLGAALGKGLGVPVSVVNDVRAAAWGEWLHGAGIGCPDLLCLFFGTGIGAGVVSGGRMLTGSNNAAGEVGHMTIDLHGALCGCGNRGCFETLAGGWGIARRAREVIAYDAVRGQRLVELAGGNSEAVTAREVFIAYREKVPVAVKVIEEFKEALVAGISSLVNIFNPSKVILGGGIIQGNLELVEVVRQGVPKQALKVSVAQLEIVPALLEGEAGIIGSSSYARKENL